MKRTLTNGFRKIKDYLITWKSKQKMFDWLLYLSIMIGIVIGIFYSFSSQVDVPWIAYVACCAFMAFCSSICYFVCCGLVYIMKEFFFAIKKRFFS